MKNLLKFATGLLAIALSAASGTATAQGPAQGPPRGWNNGGGWQQQGWANSRYNGVRQQGYHDGIYGAQKDVENNRRPTPMNRDEYRQPNVPRRDVRAYQQGFREGYNVAMRHFMRGGYWR